MKIALLADIHGNSAALDAVLTDIESHGGVEAYWILGDIVAFGHDPVGVLQRLQDLPGLLCIRGNTDRYVITGDRPPPSIDDAAASAALLPVLAEVAGSIGWTQGALTVTGWMSWLAGLPVQIEKELPNGDAVLLVHSSPGNDDGSGMPPFMCENDAAIALRRTDATLICVGHTHYVVDWRIHGQHIVNPGSIGLPRPADPRPSYAMLTATQTSYQIEHRYVEYDREAVVQCLRNMQHPGAAYIIRHIAGT